MIVKMTKAKFFKNARMIHYGREENKQISSL